jgi:hypothetical protein
MRSNMHEQIPKKRCTGQSYWTSCFELLSIVWATGFLKYLKKFILLQNSSLQLFSPVVGRWDQSGYIYREEQTSRTCALRVANCNSQLVLTAGRECSSVARGRAATWVQVMDRTNNSDLHREHHVGGTAIRYYKINVGWVVQQTRAGYAISLLMKRLGYWSWSYK